MAKIFTPNNKDAFTAVIDRTTDVEGNALEWASYYGIVAQLTVTNQAALAGTFKFQYSLDGTTWADCPALTNTAVTTIAIAANGVYTLWYPLMWPAAFCRVYVDVTAGEGDFVGKIQATKVA